VNPTNRKLSGLGAQWREQQKCSAPARPRGCCLRGRCGPCWPALAFWCCCWGCTPLRGCRVGAGLSTSWRACHVSHSGAWLSTMWARAPQQVRRGFPCALARTLARTLAGMLAGTCTRSHAHEHACTLTRTHSRTHARTHACTHACRHLQVCLHALARTRICMHAYTHAYTHTRTHALTNACTHAYTHTRTHAFTHACTHAR